jgi:acetyl esterase/lipase
MKTKLIILLTVLISTGLSGCSYKAMQKLSMKYDYTLNAIRKPAEVDNYSRDVVWASPGGEDLHADISRPDGDGPFPIVVNIHGGGFFMATKAIDEGLCRHLTNRGYAVVNVNYRLAPQHKFPAAINDCLGAVIWAKAHATDFNGDPGRVAVTGGSAGGNLVGMVALAWDDPFFEPTFKAGDLDASIKAAVPIFAVWDMTIMSFPGKDRENFYIGASLAEAPELFAKASPVSYLDRPDIVPLMLVCGDKDPLYPQSEKAAAMLEQIGAPFEFYIAHGKGHGFTNWHWQEEAHMAFDAIADWLDKTL